MPDLLCLPTKREVARSRRGALTEHLSFHGGIHQSVDSGCKTSGVVRRDEQSFVRPELTKGRNIGQYQCAAMRCRLEDCEPEGLIAFAQKTLPILQQHLQMAEALNTKR